MTGRDRTSKRPPSREIVFMRNLVILAVLIYVAILLAAAQAHGNLGAATVGDGDRLAAADRVAARNDGAPQPDSNRITGRDASGERFAADAPRE